MIQVQESRFDVGGELFLPEAGAAHDSATLGRSNEVSKADTFLIPSMGGVFKAGNIALGVAAIGAGLATNYNQNVSKGGALGSYFFNFNGLASDEVGVSLIQMQIVPAAAFRFSEHHTIGFGMAMAAQVFRAYGLEAFVDLGFASNNEALTNRGSDWSYGLGWRLGWLSEYFDGKLAFGANYNAKVNMSEFNRYSSLFAQGGDFDIPENYAVGATLKPVDNFHVVMEVGRINYSDVPSVGNPGPNVSDPADFNPLCPGPDPDICKLGGELGLGFGWRDQTVYKIGFNWEANANHAFRFGWNHAESPVPKDQILFNLLAPGIVEDTLTLGYTYVTGKDFVTKFLGADKGELTLHYSHGFKNEEFGPTIFPPSGLTAGQVENASAALVIDTLGLSYGARF
jgi:long-chain fatty acid transport protein